MGPVFTNYILEQMTPMPRVSVVIPTYNRPHLLKKLLDSLARQTAPLSTYEVIVVSDGSTDGTHDYLDGFCAEHQLFRYVVQKNQGPAAARNLGLELANGKYVAFTDDDCVASPEWVAEVSRYLDENEDVLGMEGQTVTIDNEVTPFTHQILGSGECYASCNVAYRRDAIRKAGGFDRSFFYGNEDVDVAWRVMGMGRVVYNENMVIIHPPIPLTFMKFVRVPETYGVEILLYKRHPDKYLERKKHNPLYVVFLSIGIRYLPGEVVRFLRMATGKPAMQLKVIAGLLMRRFWLLLVAPRLLAMYYGLVKENKSYVS